MPRGSEAWLKVIEADFAVRERGECGFWVLVGTPKALVRLWYRSVYVNIIWQSLRKDDVVRMYLRMATSPKSFELEH